MAESTGFFVRVLTLGGALLLAWTLASAQTASHSTTGKSNPKTASKSSNGKSSKKHKGKRSRRSSWRRRGQQKIDAARAREIQQALIREHYLSGQSTGVWDQASQSAMERYQADHGWQTKTVPDSRALIKLGLGPNHDHLLNPETAMTGPVGKLTTDPQPSTTPAVVTGDPATPPAKPTAVSGPTSTPQPQR